MATWGPIQLRLKGSRQVEFDGEASPAPGGGSKPDGAVWVFTFPDSGSTDDSKGSDGDIALLLDTGTFIQKASGTWATS